jgi:hypothetical protein
MNLELKINTPIVVDTTKESYIGNFQGYTTINQIPHLVLTTTNLEKDTIRLIAVVHIVGIYFEKIGADRL